ncbi:MAG: hypothetical protein ACK4XM_00590 [Chloroherpetonaceae bacterium]
MTEQPIKRIAQQVFKTISATLPSLETFSYSSIESLSLSPQCRAFIFAELTFSARSLLASLKSSRFNLQHDALRESRHQFADAIVAATTQLAREEFLKILESAILIEAQYLARPQKILKDLIFANRTELSRTDVSDRLGNFAEYAYLIDVFKQYLERKQPSALSAEKFEKVLFEIDAKLCAAYSHDEFMMLFKPLFDFHALAGEKAVSCAILRAFLAEKRLNDHVKRIDLAIQHGIDALTAEALNDLLLAPLDMLTSAPEPVAQTSPASTVQPAPVQSEPLRPEPATSQLAMPELAPPQLIESSPSTAAPKEPLASPEVRKEKPAPNIDFFEIEKQKILAQKAQQDSALRDVRLFISDDERKKFIKRLFKGSEAEYNQAISAINQMKTWREASLFIDREVFSRFNVDEFSSEAVAFVDIVFERFQTR